MPQVVLPVLDEALALPQVLASLPDGYEPLVVDNGSRDGSAEIAQRLGARVIYEPERGFGAACFAGLQAARDEIVCFMDCDGTLDGADLPAVTAPILAHEADLVLGARSTGADSSPRHARIANQVLAWWLRTRGVPGASDLGPMRAARRRALLALGLRDRRFGWPLEMVVAALAAGWRVKEVPVSYAPRLGRSKVTGTVRGTVRTVIDMARVAL